MITLQNILSFFSLMVSSGAIGYAVRLVIRIEVLEHLFKEKKEDMEDLCDRQNVSESDILRLKDSMSRIESSLASVVKTCENLPSINERLGTILERIGQFVPKEVIDNKIARVQDQVSNSQEKIRELSRRKGQDSD